MRSLLVAAGLITAAPVDAAPDDLVARPLVLDAGAIELRLTAEIHVQKRAVARPLSLAPDAWWGVAPRWTIGLIHSGGSVDRIEAGASLCLRRTANSVCDRVYRGSGLDVRYGALEGPLAVAPRLRLIVRDLDPFKPAATLGALARWARGRFSIASDPYVRLPLANRRLGNRASLVFPLWFAVQPARGWAIAARTGYDADFAVFRDGSHIPLGLEVTARVTGEVELAASAGWPSLLGPQHDARRGTVMLSVDWHL